MPAEYTIAELTLYPLKACRGISVSEASISSLGFLYDREWMVVTASMGRLIAQARAPKMALVQPSLPLAVLQGQAMPEDDAVLTINAPGMPTLKVPLKRPDSSTGKKGVFQGKRGDILDTVVWGWCGHGIDEGPEASDWWTRYLGMPVRLVRVPQDALDRQVECAPVGYVTGFTNTGQFLFASESSLDDLNKRLEEPVQMNRFRPNAVIRGPRAFEEDEWRSLAIVHGVQKLHFSFAMRCARCKVPNINQESALGTAIEPGKTLASYRTGELLGMKEGNLKVAYFGSYFICHRTMHQKNTKPGKFPTVAVGDVVEILSTAS